MSEYEGWSLYCDCDFVFEEDINKIFEFMGFEDIPIDVAAIDDVDIDDIEPIEIDDDIS